MLVFPNCKINIGLRVTAKRPDGFHDIETIFYPVPWNDAVEIIESKETSIHISGIPIPGSPENNLCLKAWHLIKKYYPHIPPVDIYLHKTIPAGAGLGGGSSNAAFVLKAINEKFDLGISNGQLAAFSLELGSDCPFFIYNQPMAARGRGERMARVTLPLNG